MLPRYGRSSCHRLQRARKEQTLGRPSVALGGNQLISWGPAVHSGRSFRTSAEMLIHREITEKGKKTLVVEGRVGCHSKDTAGHPQFTSCICLPAPLIRTHSPHLTTSPPLPREVKAPLPQFYRKPSSNVRGSSLEIQDDTPRMWKDAHRGLGSWYWTAVAASQGCVWAMVLFLESQSPPHCKRTVCLLGGNSYAPEPLPPWKWKPYSPLSNQNGALCAKYHVLDTVIHHPPTEPSVMLYWTQCWHHEAPWTLACLSSCTYTPPPLPKWPIHVSISSLRIDLVPGSVFIFNSVHQWVKCPSWLMNSKLQKCNCES